jgi:transposase
MMGTNSSIQRKEEDYMLSPEDRQGSFYNTDYLCERMIPQDSFYRKFRELVWPLIRDEQFESMYCQDNGRPPIRPSLLAIATILQFHRNLSDREMERACMYDIEIKYALGLRLDERPFDHSSLGDFRNRLIENGKEKEVFDRILNHLIQTGLIEKNEIQRIDATHIIADVAIPTMVNLVKKGVFEVLKPLKKRHPEVLQRIEKEIHIEEYTREKLNQDYPGRFDMEERKKKLVEVVLEARTVLKQTEAIQGDEILNRRVEMLKRILQENIEEDETGNPKEKERKEKPPDLLVSPIDPDARYGAKSRTKLFMGYKANVTESITNRLITNIKAMRGNQRDGNTAVKTVLEQKQHGLTPQKLIGDTAYGDGLYRKALKEEGTTIIAPGKEKGPQTKAIYPKSMFTYDEQNNTLTCPVGVTTQQTFYDKNHELKVFHFPMTECGKCDQKPKCTNAKEGRRTVGISPYNKELREAEIYNKTEQFKADMKLRPPIEGKHSEMKRYHGLQRARYRGLKKLDLQCYFTAAAVNIKRWINIKLEKIQPQITRVAFG